jgi:hypothetical protein
MMGRLTQAIATIEGFCMRVSSCEGNKSVVTGVCRLSICLAAQVLIGSIAPIVAFAQSSANVSAEPVDYGPKKTTLIGRLIIETRLGPPNYGEDPSTDKEVKIYILRLSTPITARQFEGKQGNASVQKVELFFFTRQGPFGWDAAHRAIGKCLSVVGEVEPPQVGTEFTALIVNVDKFVILKANSRSRACSSVDR